MRGASISQTAFFALALLVLGSAGRKHLRERTPHAQSPSTLHGQYESPYDALLSGAACEVPLTPKVMAPKNNVWTGKVSSRERASIMHWIHHQQPKLPNTTAIQEITLITPNKTDVLNYLDNNNTEPVRYASALLYHDETPPYYSYMSVGPLPISNATTMEPLKYPFTNNGTIRCLMCSIDYKIYEKFNKQIRDSVKDITNDVWNGTGRHGAYAGGAPYWQYNDKITEWSQYWGLPHGAFDSGDLLPLGLYYKTTYDLYGADSSTWTFDGWLYNDIYYKTTEEFRKAYFSPSFEKLGANVDGLWTHTDQRGPVFPLDKSEPPPMPVAQSARFSVDYRQQYVEWMGFSFYMTFRQDVGMTLYDIRFKGERIIYELGIQEALAHYAGNDPVQSGTSYLDSAYGLGGLNELMPGFDCPSYASYLNSTEDLYVKDIKSVCLFEFDADYSIQRHAYQSNTKNIYFVVRTISTVGNYDYSFSYEFYMDGSIQVVVRAAGYIQSAYYAKNSDYGYHIHDFLSGSLHDHVLNFKADFDILGTSNTMELVSVEPVTESYVWSDQPRNTMKLVRSDITSEDESRLFWSGNGKTQYRIINKDKINKYGEYRGYRILPSQGTIHLAVKNSSNLVNAANWAYHDLQITKQKDTEPRSAHPDNGENVYDPLVNFDDFFDGESLQQEDLVLWFNLGMHHIPHTGDIPNTVFTTAHSAIQITPSNYFDHDQSRDTVQMIRLVSKPNHTEVLTFGAAPQMCMPDLSQISGY